MDEPQSTNIYEALLHAQADMGPVLRNATNPAFRSKYADLGSVIETIEGPLRKHKLLFYQRIDLLADGSPVLWTTIVYGPTGEKIESTAPLVCKDPTNPQAIGGAVTYFRRYSLLALLGLAPEDDDGQAAAKPAPTARTAAPTPFPAAKPAEAEADEPPAELINWSGFWKWAKAELNNPRLDKSELEAFIGASISPMTPQQAKDAVIAKKSRSLS